MPSPNIQERKRGYWQDIAEKIAKSIDVCIDNGNDELTPINEASAANHLTLMRLGFPEVFEEHHTDLFAACFVVFRRGQDFKLGLEFQRPFNFNRDKCTLYLAFDLGNTYAELITLPVSDNEDFTQDVSQWDVRLHEQNGREMTLYVRCPVSASVGSYYLKAVVEADGEPALTFDRPAPFTVIFNPWCQEDAVYMEDEEWRQEYVMNPCGKIFQGTHDLYPRRGVAWIYGQFHNVVLTAFSNLLGFSGLDYQDRSNPIKIVRALSTLVNSNDKSLHGVLLGKWNGSFSDGKAPSAWTGSVEILWKYLQNQCTPVKYGQCWVFGGLVTTLSRALGIPCRTVTCFNSAHDRNKDLMIDIGRKIVANGIDREESCWNFHCWNECWMTRPDLLKGYGGWQVVDSTPQEPDNNIYRCGPCSVHAVLKGQVDHAYNAPFVFAEVNSDYRMWITEGEDKVVSWSSTHQVGVLLLTRMPFVPCDHVADSDEQDITEQYKYREGTVEERMAVQNAARIQGVTELFQMPEPENEDCKMTLDINTKIDVGDPLRVAVILENLSKEDRTIKTFITLDSVYYNGIKGQEMRQEKYDCELYPEQSKDLEIILTCEEYCDKLVDMAFCKIHAHAKVEETNQTWHGERTIQFAKPKLALSGPDTIEKGEVYVLEISFQNPLDRYLSDGVFAVQGTGFSLNAEDSFSSPFGRDIEPLETVYHTVELVAKQTGDQNLVVRFNSDRLSNLSGSKKVTVD